jgi:RNA polymerase sigma factor (sigma-70 family)
MSEPSKKERFMKAYLDYYPLVYGTLYTRVANRDDADDLCQEVFIIFYNKIEEIENGRKWLMGTMKNVVLKYYRDKKADAVDIDSLFDDMGMTFINGFKDTRLIIKQSMEEIETDDEERQILDLVAIHNYNYSEVAGFLGLSRRQVQYRYIKTIEKIMAQLKKKGIQNIEDLL